LHVLYVYVLLPIRTHTGGSCNCQRHDRHALVLVLLEAQQPALLRITGNVSQSTVFYYHAPGFSFVAHRHEEPGFITTTLIKALNTRDCVLLAAGE
jgi:hypothetical protein